jgi:hypothetical protein|tara:strand:+ start:553 stop:2070 length:1518 start_codon:yes stop_codon:yes gene_type:complete
MAITRSQIARQLLAEGGAPRKGFMFGGPGSGYGSAQDTFDAAGGNPGAYGGPSRSDPPGGGSGNGSDNDPMMKPGPTGATFPNLNKVTPKDVFKVSATNPLLYRSNFERAALASLPIFGPIITAGEQNAYNFPMFQYSRTGGGDKFKDDDEYTDDNNIVKPMMPMIPKLPTDIEPEKSDYDEFVQRFTLPEQYRLANGGEVRQAYGLGKLVKKVTGAVKKVAKSDLGKAALLATGAYFAPAAFGGTAGFGAGSTYGRFFSGLMNPNLIGPLSKAGEFGRFLSGTGKGKAILGIGAATVASGILSPKQEEEVDSLSSRIADNTGIDVAQIRKEVQEAYASGNTEKLKTKYPFLITESAAAADGGRIGFDNGGIMMASNIQNDRILEDLFEKYLDMGLSPKDAEKAARQEFDRMSKKQDTDRTMAAGGGMMNPNDEMLNMGGNEMDLRGGGFVPIGEYEKKDDVPARLSKNEFVFTADAVRAAGGGSVDRGADLMYKTMKQLENKVV